MRKIGNCHCGSVKFSIPFDGEFKKTRRCNCSMCARRGAVVASVKMEDLTIEDGEDKLSLYKFGTFIAKHYFCSICGIYTFHQRRSDPSEYAVNITCFDDVKIEDYAHISYNDGRDNHPKDSN
jgi:hypothetical protein